jgi:DNA-binding beta-propeller fold protein YncE
VALGGHLYVLNCFSCTGRSSGISAAGGSISVIDQVSGAEVAEWSPFGTDELPTSIATDGTHLWVVDAAGLLGGKSQLVELSTTGAVVRTLAWPGSKPTSLLALDGRLWVAQRGSTALTAIDPVSAQLLASVASTTRQPAPTALASDGTHLWVASAAGLSERDAHTGALLATVPSAKATLSAPVAMAYSATLLWVVSHSYGAGDSLCSVSVKTATITSCRNARVAALAHPVAIVADSSHLYVANFDRSTVVQYSLAGAVTKTLSARAWISANPWPSSTTGDRCSC